MRSSFLDSPNFFQSAAIIILSLAMGGIFFAACSGPDTPEEKAAYNETYSDRAKEDMIVVSPRPGVECYILRGRHNTEPRVMSCVVLTKESN
jgi:hypothetical protein